MRAISQRKVFPVNNNKRLLLQSALALAAAAIFSSGAMAQDKPIKVGVTGGPHAQIFEQVKKVAEKDGLKIQIVEFSDYVQPNAALAAGDPPGRVALRLDEDVPGSSQEVPGRARRYQVRQVPRDVQQDLRGGIGEA